MRDAVTSQAYDINDCSQSTCVLRQMNKLQSAFKFEYFGIFLQVFQVSIIEGFQGITIETMGLHSTIFRIGVVVSCTLRIDYSPQYSPLTATTIEAIICLEVAQSGVQCCTSFMKCRYWLHTPGYMVGWISFLW